MFSVPVIERRDHRHDRQERGPDVGDAHHHPFQVLRRALAGPIAGDEAAVVLQVVGHVLGIEDDGRPEVAEDVDQDDEQDGVAPALALEDVLDARRPSPSR